MICNTVEKFLRFNNRLLYLYTHIINNYRMSLVDIESHACSELGRFKRKSRATLINIRNIKLAIRQRRKVMDSNKKREKDRRHERRGEINRERQRARNRKHNGKASREKTRRRREMYSSSRLAAITIRYDSFSDFLYSSAYLQYFVRFVWLFRFCTVHPRTHTRTHTRVVSRTRLNLAWHWKGPLWPLRIVFFSLDCIYVQFLQKKYIYKERERERVKEKRGKKNWNWKEKWRRVEDDCSIVGTSRTSHFTILFLSENALCGRYKTLAAITIATKRSFGKIVGPVRDVSSRTKKRDARDVTLSHLHIGIDLTRQASPP